MVSTKNEIVIKVENVYKSFKIPHEKQNSLKSTVLNLFKKKTYTQHDAAKGISFEVKKGEFLGIIGRNGCGKSTMLKMLAGIYLPNKGEITVNGRLSPFLELGVGFNPELTARDNVYLNGVILGLTRKEVDEKFDEIIEFAELEEFVDQKLKNFSSGMQVRLAFSVAIQAHADILLIDEVLAVGDMNFQKKCFDVFFDLKSRGKTIVFVTHNMKSIERFCDRVILIDEAKILIEGTPDKVAMEYEKLNMSLKNVDFKSKNAPLVVKSIDYLVDKKRTSPVFLGNQPFSIEFKIENITSKPITFFMAVGIYLDARKCFVTSSESSGKRIIIKAKTCQTVTFDVKSANLLPGAYDLSYNLYQESQSNALNAMEGASGFSIYKDNEDLGVTKVDYRWEV